ncbi:hypothetical protein G9A89_021491 [Geosiphon pyriformis]|nr:hypothetical protein G9A89_021491 [Geosiphon pyriformis]
MHEVLTLGYSTGKRPRNKAVTPQWIQPPIWKKHRIESPTNPSYYYTPKSAINIASAGMSTSNMTSTFGQFPFQSKQRKEDLLGPYVQQLQQQLQLPIQQQQPIVLMAFISITKLKKFTSEENDAQAWINDVAKAIIANNWNDTRTMQVIPYFLKDTADLCRVYYYQQISHGNKKCEFATTVVNKVTLEPIAVLIIIHNQEINIRILIAATHNILTTATNSLSTTTNNSNTTTKPSYNNIQKPQIQSNPKLEIGDSSSPTNSQFNKSTIRITPFSELLKSSGYLEDTASSKQETNQKPLTHNIPSAASTKDKSLAVIFLFKLEEITSVSLFNGAALDTKPITTMYTNAKVIDQYIKLILNSGLTDSIITKQLMDQLADGATKTFIGEIDDFPFEVNGIIVLIKVLVMEATQYQALVGRRKKTTWEAYQVLWADDDYNKLLPILSWDNNDNKKRKQREEHIWGTTIDAWTDDNQSELLLTISWEEKGKGKEKEENKTQSKDGQVHTPFASCYHSHYLFYLNAKTVERNSCLWENEFAKASETTNYVSLVVNSYSMKECGMTFLVEEEHVMLYAMSHDMPITAAWHRAIN